MIIDEKLEALPPGETMFISCPTPYCSGIGGKCAKCKTVWTACDCFYNEFSCKCGERAEKLPSNVIEEVDLQDDR